jgi:hypothetical protein
MFRIATLALLGIVGCSGGGPTDRPAPLAGPDAEAAVSLRNATDVPIVFIAAGEGTLALIHVPARLEPEQFDNPAVPAGQVVPVEDIIGYLPELGVTFHIYRVDPVRGDAGYAGSFLATAAELARTGGLVTVTPARL